MNSYSDKNVSRRNFSLARSFACAGNGFLYALCTQRSMKIHIVAAVAAILLGFVLQIGRLEWIAILLCVAAVFSAECFNTALESLVNLVSPEYHELARHAKDCAAAAVLVFACVSVVVAFVVYLPHLASLL